MGKSTAADVARAANVSCSTVDRVLNNRGGVDKEKERRVLEYARKLNLDRALNHRAARTLRVGVLLQPPDNPFHAAVQAQFEAVNRDHSGFNIQFRIAHVDPIRPQDTCKLINSLAASCDGLIIVSVHDEEIASNLNAIITGGKPVVTLATPIRGVGAQIYVGPDNRKAGRIAGDLMARFLGCEGGDVIMIAGLLSMIGHEEREMGFRAVLRERHSHCRITDVLESREKGERAGDLVHNALLRNPAIRGIYNASAGAQSVVDAIKALGREGDIVFITHELTEERRRLLRQGRIDAIIDQDPVAEVRTAVEVLASHFGRSGPAPVPLTTPTHIHTIENC